MKTNTSKKRRLRREIERLEEGISFTKEMIKHDPYKDDLPGLRRELAIWLTDLADAKRELNLLK